VDRAAIVNGLDLDASDEVDLDAIVLVYQGKNAHDRHDYLRTTEAAFGLAEKGYFTEAQWRTELEI